MKVYRVPSLAASCFAWNLTVCGVSQFWSSNLRTTGFCAPFTYGSSGIEVGGIVELQIGEPARLVLRRECRRHDIHDHLRPGFRLPCQANGVRVELPPFATRGRALGHARNAAALRYDDERLLVVADVRGNAVHRGAHPGGVALLDAVEDDPAVALEVVADDRNRRVARRAADEEAVAAQAAVDFGDDLDAGREHEEAVVALGAVGHELLDVDVGDVQAGAEDARVGDDEVVGELGADDAHRVEAVAAVDADRRVDDVQDRVGAGVAFHVGAAALAVRRARRARRPAP